MSDNTTGQSMGVQKIGVLGGTFDPIHLGHLLLAEHAREQLGLDQVRFLPAASSPLKPDGQATDAKHRVEMVKLSIGGNPHFTVDERELKRGGTSYTVETLEELHMEQPAEELFFLMGADSLEEFDAWKSPERICQLAHIAVVARGGRTKPDLQRLQKYLPDADHRTLTQHLICMPQIEISATNLRYRIAHGQSIRYQVHPGVGAYIEAHGLYR